MYNLVLGFNIGPTAFNGVYQRYIIWIHKVYIFAYNNIILAFHYMLSIHPSLFFYNSFLEPINLKKNFF